MASGTGPSRKASSIASETAPGGLASVPTLITFGDRDLVCRPDHAADLRAALPHATVQAFEGVGHLPFIEAPAAFGAAALGALR